MSAKLKWIAIPDSVLSINNFDALTEEDTSKVERYLAAGVLFSALKQAALEYSLCYRSTSCWFQIRRKILLKQELHPLEKSFFEAHTDIGQISGWWKCYWNGDRVIWRQEAYSGSNGDPSLSYSSRNSHVFRHMLRGA